MTDVVSLFSEIVTRWNDEERCGFCWKFTAPMYDSELNEFQFTESDKCCILVAITDYGFEEIISRNTQTFLPSIDVVHTFNLHFLSTGDLGRNMYNEIKDHPLAESKWATILNPIRECIGLSGVLAECPNTIIIDRWLFGQNSVKLNWLDNNYDGWSVNVRLIDKNV